MLYQIIKIKHEDFPQTAYIYSKSLLRKKMLNIVICDKITPTEPLDNVYIHRHRDYYEYYIGGNSCIMKCEFFTEDDTVYFKTERDFNKWLNNSFCKDDDRIVLEIKIGI